MKKLKHINFIWILSAIFLGCNIAPEVTAYPTTQSSLPGDRGTIYPQIQLVTPGKLQSLDIPVAYPTDVNPDAATITVLFSNTMENDSGEMNFAFELLEDNSSIPITITPTTSSKYFIIKPIASAPTFSGVIKEYSVYTLRIFDSAYLDNDSTRGLNFENLILPPASTLNPVNPNYIEYTFRTGAKVEADTTPPTIISTTPIDGALDADPTASLEVVFNDNLTPMVDPDTVVANTTITLTKIIGNTSINIRVDQDSSTDPNFRVFTIVPLDPLTNGTEYRLCISKGNTIKDFRGNATVEKNITFTTIE